MQEYPGVNKEFKIITVFDSGKYFIVLEDGSKWETTDFKVGVWQENSLISITLCNHQKFFSYYLKNLNENERVKAFFVGYTELKH